MLNDEILQLKSYDDKTGREISNVFPITNHEAVKVENDKNLKEKLIEINKQIEQTNVSLDQIDKKVDSYIEDHNQDNANISIDDTACSKEKTWSSYKIEDFVHANDSVIWNEIQGENSSIDYTKAGYLREIEIWGNTIQNTEHVSDIQHLGELYVDDMGEPILDLQERKQYKIEMISHGDLAYKNISYNGHINGGKYLGNNRYSITPNGGYAMCSFQLNPNDVNIGDKFKIILEVESKTEDIDWNDVSMEYCAGGWFGNPIRFEKKIGKQVVDGTIQKLPQTLSRFVIIQTSPNVNTGKVVFKINIIFEKESHKTTILLPCQLMKVGDIFDKLYWDNVNSKYIIEKRIKQYLVTGDEFTIDLNKNAQWKKENTFRYRTNVPLFSDYEPISDSQTTINNLSTLSTAVSYMNMLNNDIEGISSTNKYNAQVFVLSILKSKITSTLQHYFTNNQTYIYYPAKPQKIDTNITEQIEILSHKNKTYLCVLGGINGNIKAKVPVDGGKAIQTLNAKNLDLVIENNKLQTMNNSQDDLINKIMLATDEMLMILEPLLTETFTNEKKSSKIVDMYAAMIQRGIKNENDVPIQYKEHVKQILDN